MRILERPFAISFHDFIDFFSTAWLSLSFTSAFYQQMIWRLMQFLNWPLMTREANNISMQTVIEVIVLFIRLAVQCRLNLAFESNNPRWLSFIQKSYNADFIVNYNMRTCVRCVRALPENWNTSLNQFWLNSNYDLGNLIA